MDLDNFQVRLQYGVASLCNQLLPEFSSNQFETFHRCYKHIEDVHVTFSRKENNFGQNYGILDLDNFQVRLQYWVEVCEINSSQSFQAISLKLYTDAISILKMCM